MLFQTKLCRILLLTTGAWCLAVIALPLAPSFAGSLDGDQPGLSVASQRASASAETLFDDFSYSNFKQLSRHDWIIRTAAGWPGIPGAKWGNRGVSFVSDRELRGNRFLRMVSSTDGTGDNTYQSQICHQRKYFEGTYAARVRFVDLPTEGPRGDQLVESFYAISPLKAPMDPDYSELDFEYLPNGGWGSAGPTLFTTSWRTFSPEPNWQKDNVFNTSNGSLAGWHTLITQVSGGKVKYFIDGRMLAEHSGKYYPRSPMSINFNLWFIRDATVKSSEVRHYQEDIDWVFHAARKVLAPAEVEAAVASLRKRSVGFQDTVPALVPVLPSPCDY